MFISIVTKSLYISQTCCNYVIPWGVWIKVKYSILTFIYSKLEISQLNSYDYFFHHPIWFVDLVFEERTNSVMLMSMLVLRRREKFNFPLYLLISENIATPSKQSLSKWNLHFYLSSTYKSSQTINAIIQDYCNMLNVCSDYKMIGSNCNFRDSLRRNHLIVLFISNRFSHSYVIYEMLIRVLFILCFWMKCIFFLLFFEK